MLTQHLERILAWADARAPGLRALLRPGASRASIEAVERTLGAALPADVVALYRLHDGQHPRDVITGLIFGNPFLSLEEALGEWSAWQRLLARDPGLQDDCAEFMTSYPPGAVEPVYINPAWFPLTRDGSGNHIGVDLAPGPQGPRGQVIVFGRDENEKLQIARSVTDFFAWSARQLESGNVVVDGEHVTLKEPRLHLHDAARKLRKAGGPLA